jgi:hypothetical protein
MRIELERFRGFVFGAVIAGAGLVALAPTEAHAQAAEEETGAVSGTAKGIVGGAFLGAEIVMMPMGIAGLKPWWPYVVFGSVGAVGGAVGGWAVEQAEPPAEAPLYMLAGGLALVIPTLVLTLNATTRDDFEEAEGTTVVNPDGSTVPPPDGTQPPPGDGTTPPPAEGGTTIQIQSKRKKPRKTARAPSGFALFNLSNLISGHTTVEVGVPAIEVRPTYSNDEIAKFGVQQENEVRIPVVSTSF